MRCFVPQIHVSVAVFIVDHEDENYNPVYFSFASTRIFFQRNQVERIVVDSHPFVIKYEFPTVDILYDNKEQELLASMNIEDLEDHEISDTTLNVLGYMFSAKVTILDKGIELIESEEESQS